MAILSVRLTTKGQNLKGQLAVECKTKHGTQLKRHYKLVQGLKSPTYTPDCWNERQGLFIAGENAAFNNQVTKSLLETLNTLIGTDSYLDGRQLFAAYEYAKNNVTADKPITFSKYVEIVRDEEKERPTTNYELYNTFLNALNGVNKKHKGHHKTFEPPTYNGIRLADIPISKISDEHFEAFGNWIKTVKNGAGYKNLMTTFKAVISRAKKLNSNTLTYEWRKYRPVKAQKAMTAKQRIETKGRAITVLSTVEFKKFETLNVSDIVPQQDASKKLAQIYKDAVLLMYYTKSRPSDVISFSWAENYDEETNTLVYTPRKLANRLSADGTPRLVTLKLPQQAIDIINRYKGQSKGGYLLPLPMNERKWDTVKDFAAWNIRIKNVEQRINALLKKIASMLKFDALDLSLYDFRHSAITHALNAGENPFSVAQMAGTSVIKIEQHYYNSIRK